MVKRRFAVLTMVLACLLARDARAETYPSHPITMGMPFAAGGPGDVMERDEDRHHLSLA